MHWRPLLGTILLSGALAIDSAHGLSQKFGWDYSQNTGPNPDLAVGFNIYRSASCTGTWAKLNSLLLPLTALTYVDATVIDGQTYCWQVKAVDAGGLESGPSYLLTFQIVAPVLNVPTNLRAVGAPTP